MTDTSPLPVLQAGGFTAHVDAYAAAPEPDPATHLSALHFLSLLGSKQAVQALWARLVKGEPATLSREVLGVTRLCALAPGGPRGWKLFAASLPDAAGYHAMLVPEATLITANRPEFVLLPRQSDKAASLHFRFLDRRVDLPLHPSWADWLWERARRTGEAVALEAFGLAGFRCAPNLSALASDLSESVRAGILSVTGSPGEERAKEPETMRSGAGR